MKHAIKSKQRRMAVKAELKLLILFCRQRGRGCIVVFTPTQITMGSTRTLVTLLHSCMRRFTMIIPS